jgi:hypothetical protein
MRTVRKLSTPVDKPVETPRAARGAKGATTAFFRRKGACNPLRISPENLDLTAFPGR